MAILADKVPTIREKGRPVAYEGQARDAIFDGDTALEYDDVSARDAVNDTGIRPDERMVDGSARSGLDALIWREEQAAAEGLSEEELSAALQDGEISAEHEPARREGESADPSDANLEQSLLPPADRYVPGDELPDAAAAAEEAFDRAAGEEPKGDHSGHRTAHPGKHRYGRGDGIGGNQHQPKRRPY